MKPTVSSRVTQGVLKAVVLLIAAICVLPFLMVLGSSLNEENDIVRNGYTLWPRVFDLTAYRVLIADGSRIGNAYRITITVTLIGTAASLLICAFAAYPLSQKRVKYRKAMNLFVLVTMLFSGGMVPWFIVCRNMLQLKDSVAALILPYLANAWYIFLLRNYFGSIPEELSEAAMIDGASELRTFFSVILPTSTPILASVALFISLGYWNDWWLGLMLVDKTELQPLQLLLRTITSNIQFFSSSNNASAIANLVNVIPAESIKMATCIVTIGPILLVYPFVQRYFVKGIMVGAVKG